MSSIAFVTVIVFAVPSLSPDLALTYSISTSCPALISSSLMSLSFNLYFVLLSMSKEYFDPLVSIITTLTLLSFDERITVPLIFSVFASILFFSA